MSAQNKGVSVELDAEEAAGGNIEALAVVVEALVAACVTSDARDEFIQSIMDLDEAHQVQLMHAVSEYLPDGAQGGAKAEESVLSDVVPGEEQEDEVTLGEVAAMRSQLEQLQEALEGAQARATFAETENSRLEEECEKLRSQQQRSVQGLEMELEAAAAASMHLSKREAELEEATTKVRCLTTEVAHLKRTLEEMDSLRDEVDVLRAQAAEKVKADVVIARLKERLEAARAAQEQLTTLESNNAELLKQTIELQKEVDKLPGLRRQLDKAKEDRCDLDVKLQDTLSEFEEFRTSMDPLKREVERLRSEVKTLSEVRLLQATTASLDPAMSSLGSGVSEFNPELNARLALLEAENSKLKEVLEMHDEERVSSLVEQLEHSQQLRERFHKQYREELARSTSLGEQLEEERSKCAQLEASLGRVTEDRDLTKEELATVSRRAEQAEELGVGLRKQVVELEAALEDAKQEVERLETVLEEVKTEASSALEKASTELQDAMRAHQAELESAQSLVQSEKSEMERQHTERVEQLLEQHREEMKSTMLELNAHSSAQIEAMELQHGQELADLRQERDRAEAAKEQEFEALKQQLATSENEAGHTVKSLKDIISAQSASIKEQASQISTLESEAKALSFQLRATEEAHAASESKLSALSDEHEDAMRRYQLLDRKRLRLEDDLRKAKSASRKLTASEMEAHVAELEARNQEAVGKLQVAEKELVRLRTICEEEGVPASIMAVGAVVGPDVESSEHRYETVEEFDTREARAAKRTRGPQRVEATDAESIAEGMHEAMKRLGAREKELEDRLKQLELRCCAAEAESKEAKTQVEERLQEVEELRSAVSSYQLRQRRGVMVLKNKYQIDPKEFLKAINVGDVAHRHVAPEESGMANASASSSASTAPSAAVAVPATTAAKDDSDDSDDDDDAEYKVGVVNVESMAVEEPVVKPVNRRALRSRQTNAGMDASKKMQRRPSLYAGPRTRASKLPVAPADL
jgi:chromosome segregation ATPase